MIDPMEEKFMFYWGNLPMHLFLAAIVDHRLKLEGVKLCISEICKNLIFSNATHPSTRLRFL